MHKNLDFDIYASRYHPKNFPYFLFLCIHIYLSKVQDQVESPKNKGKSCLLLFIAIALYFKSFLIDELPTKV